MGQTSLLDRAREPVHILRDLGPSIPQHPHELTGERRLVVLTRLNFTPKQTVSRQKD